MSRIGMIGAIALWMVAPLSVFAGEGLEKMSASRIVCGEFVFPNGATASFAILEGETFRVWDASAPKKKALTLRVYTGKALALRTPSSLDRSIVLYWLIGGPKKEKYVSLIGQRIVIPYYGAAVQVRVTAILLSGLELLSGDRVADITPSSQLFSEVAFENWRARWPSVEY